MLILALLMVLFANHMDERMAEGKSVIRCGGTRRRETLTSEEKEPLLVNSHKEIGKKENNSEDSENETA